MKPVESFIGSAFHPITSAIGRAFTIPGLGGLNAPAVPQAPPAQTPSGTKPSTSNAQNQLSFLTAASKAAAAQSGGATGKTLLGQ